jgi:hypothetical protein
MEHEIQDLLRLLARIRKEARRYRDWQTVADCDQGERTLSALLRLVTPPAPTSVPAKASE